MHIEEGIISLKCGGDGLGIDSQGNAGFTQSVNASGDVSVNNLVTAKRSYLSAERDALIAEANWIQAKGETLDYDK